MPSHAPPRRRARPHVSARSRAFARAHTSAIFPSPSSAPVSRSRPSSPACPLSLCLSLSLSRALHIRTFPVLFIARRRSRRRGGRHAVRRGTVVVHRRRARRRVPCGSSKVFFLGVCSGNIGRSDTRGSLQHMYRYTFMQFTNDTYRSHSHNVRIWWAQPVIGEALQSVGHPRPPCLHGPCPPCPP